MLLSRKTWWDHTQGLSLHPIYIVDCVREAHSIWKCNNQRRYVPQEEKDRSWTIPHIDSLTSLAFRQNNRRLYLDSVNIMETDFENSFLERKRIDAIKLKALAYYREEKKKIDWKVNIRRSRIYVYLLEMSVRVAEEADCVLLRYRDGHWSEQVVGVGDGRRAVDGHNSGNL